jgi:hypothetical protein
MNSVLFYYGNADMFLQKLKFEDAVPTMSPLFNEVLESISWNDASDGMCWRYGEEL